MAKIHHWPLNEHNFWEDVVGGNNLTPVGAGPVYTGPGKEQGLSFALPDKSYGHANVPGMEFGTNDFTISFWAKQIADTGYDHWLFGSWIAGETSWFVRSYNKDLRFYACDNGSGSGYMTFTSSFHFVIGGDPSLVVISRSGQNYNFYVDGVSAGSTTTGPASIYEGTETFYFGSAGGTNYSREFMVSNLEIWDTAFSSAEAADLYASKTSVSLVSQEGPKISKTSPINLAIESQTSPITSLSMTHLGETIFSGGAFVAPYDGYVDTTDDHLWNVTITSFAGIYESLFVVIETNAENVDGDVCLQSFVFNTTGEFLVEDSGFENVDPVDGSRWWHRSGSLFNSQEKEPTEWPVPPQGQHVAAFRGEHVATEHLTELLGTGNALYEGLVTRGQSPIGYFGNITVSSDIDGILFQDDGLGALGDGRFEYFTGNYSFNVSTASSGAQVTIEYDVRPPGFEQTFETSELIGRLAGYSYLRFDKRILTDGPGFDFSLGLNAITHERTELYHEEISSDSEEVVTAAVPVLSTLNHKLYATLAYHGPDGTVFSNGSVIEDFSDWDPNRQFVEEARNIFAEDFNWTGIFDPRAEDPVTGDTAPDKTPFVITDASSPVGGDVGLGTTAGYLYYSGPEGPPISTTCGDPPSNPYDSYHPDDSFHDIGHVVPWVGSTCPDVTRGHAEPYTPTSPIVEIGTVGGAPLVIFYGGSSMSVMISNGTVQADTKDMFDLVANAVGSASYPGMRSYAKVYQEKCRYGDYHTSTRAVVWCWHQSLGEYVKFFDVCVYDKNVFMLQGWSAHPGVDGGARNILTDDISPSGNSAVLTFTTKDVVVETVGKNSAGCGVDITEKAVMQYA